MREREKVVQTYDQGRRQLKPLEARAAVAVELSDRRTLLDKRRQERATVEALLEADRHAQRLLTDTRTCPFFMDVCRNLDAIPDVAGVFRRQAVEREKRLAELRAAIADNERAVSEAEQAESESREADVVRERLAGLSERLDSADADIAAATALLDALETRNAADLAVLANGKRQARSAQGALVQSARRAADALTRLASTEDAAAKTTGAELLAVAERRAEAAGEGLTAVDAELATLRDDLNALAEARSTLQAKSNAHTQFLQHEVVAGQLQARTAELDTVRQAATAAEVAVSNALADLKEARARFDPEALAEARQTRDAALGLARQLAERIVRMQADEARLVSDFEALRQVRVDLQAAQDGDRPGHPP